MRRVLLILIITVLLAGCGGDDDKNENKGNSGPAPTATPVMADLAVTNIELDPAQVAAGQPFTIKVYVTNRGNAPSGGYDLDVNLRDVTRGTTSPVGALKGQSIAPGEEVLAYETGQRTLDQSGSFQVLVDLRPAGPDRETNNNKQNRAFTIQ